MNRILEIINEWDPIELCPMAPKDEYMEEVHEIEKIISCKDSITAEELGEKINQLFIKRFGADVYEDDIAQCVSVAKKILSI